MNVTRIIKAVTIDKLEEEINRRTKGIYELKGIQVIPPTKNTYWVAVYWWEG